MITGKVDKAANLTPYEKTRRSVSNDEGHTVAHHGIDAASMTLGADESHSIAGKGITINDRGDITRSHGHS